MRSQRIALHEAGKVAAHAFLAQSQKYEFAFLDAELPMGRVSSWRVKVLRSSHQNWLGVGIALRQEFLQRKFSFSSGDLGVGAYLISHNGMTYSEFLRRDHRKNKGLFFKAGDILRVSFDPSRSIVTFAKEAAPLSALQQQEQYQLSVTIPFEDSFYACFGFNHCGTPGEQALQLIGDVEYENPSY